MRLPGVGLLGWAARAAWRRLATRLRPDCSAYELLDPAAPPGAEPSGWLLAEVANRQEAAYAPLMAGLERGAPRADMLAAAAAVRHAGITRPSLLEVGCGGGHYARVLARLLPVPLGAYLGLDRSPHMLALARRREPGHPFVIGDATRLPFADASFDLVLDGGALLHVLRWREALAEARRVARAGVVLHQVPLVRGRPTALVRKRAYGGPVLEWVWAEEELRAAMRSEGLRLEQSWHCADYDLSGLLGVPTELRTFLCRVTDSG